MGGIQAGVCGVHQVPAGECFRLHYPNAHRAPEDTRCMVCRSDTYGPDNGSVSVMEWNPQLKVNILRVFLCTDPECLIAWVDKKEDE